MAKNTEKTQAELYREQRKARLAKAAAKKAKKSKSVSLSKGAKTTIAVLIVVALVAGIAGYAVSSMGIQNRKTMVLNIGEGLAEVSQAEYSFYYSSVFSNYFNTAYQYDSYYGQGYGAMFTGGYDYSVAPDAQKYTEELEGYEDPTWADYFESSSIQTIMNIKALNKLAAEEGITLDEEDLAQVEEYLNQIEEGAAQGNFSVSAYLKTYYGDGVSKKLVEKILTEQTLASKYEETKMAEYGDKYTDEEIEKLYKKDRDAYDKVGLAYYLVKAETVTSKDDEGNETSKVTDETMKAAKKAAQKLAKSESLDALSAAVDKHADKEGSLNKYPIVDYETISSNMSEDIAKWIYGKDIEVGDINVIEYDDTGYFVCYVMATPYRDDTLPVNVRHILINFAEEKEESKDTADEDAEDATEEETTEAAEEKTEVKDFPALDTFKDAVIDMKVDAESAKQPETYNKAELLLREFLSGDRTEDSFAALATANTEDTGSKETGGLYEDVKPGDMVTEFNDWCFDESRKPGDVGMVETTYGYHIMYYVDKAADEPTWKSSIREENGSNDYVAFAEENVTKEKYPIEVLNQEAMDEAEAFTIKLAKRQIANLSAAG